MHTVVLLGKYNDDNDDDVLSKPPGADVQGRAKVIYSAPAAAASAETVGQGDRTNISSDSGKLIVRLTTTLARPSRRLQCAVLSTTNDGRVLSTIAADAAADAATITTSAASIS